MAFTAAGKHFLIGTMSALEESDRPKRVETVWKLNFRRCAREIADRVDRVYYVELALIEHRVRKKAPRGFSFQPTSSPSSSLQLQVC